MTSLPPLPVSPSAPMAPAPATSAPPRRRNARRAAALATAGGLLATVIGVGLLPGPSNATGEARVESGSAQAQAAPPEWGTQPEGGTARSSTAVDAEPATDEQSAGVVSVETALGSGDGQAGLGEGAGTGIVLTADGQVLTNYHVVESSADIRVTVATTGRTFDAEVVGASESADVALLQLEGASGLAPAKIDDDTLALGDEVTAVGNAGGTGDLTAAAGTVTDLDTSITVSSGGEATRLTDLIETDADVQSGESGGPLLDAEGEVVGVTTAASVGGEIDGYAVTITDALAVVTQIRSGTETDTVRIGEAAFLGVQLAPTSGRLAGDDGALLAGVTAGGAAAAAGLEAGDTVTGLGSTTIDDATDLQSAIAALDPGDEVEIRWSTADGDVRTATVTLQASAVA